MTYKKVEILSGLPMNKGTPSQDPINRARIKWIKNRQKKPKKIIDKKILIFILLINFAVILPIAGSITSVLTLGIILNFLVFSFLSSYFKIF